MQKLFNCVVVVAILCLYFFVNMAFDEIDYEAGIRSLFYNLHESAIEKNEMDIDLIRKQIKEFI